MVNRTIISFDFGTKSIGVAIGQDVTGTAQPLMAFKAKNGAPEWSKVKKMLEEWQPDLIVVGFPLNMDGTEQPLTERARKFANCLRIRFEKKVELQDERLSTVEARTDLFNRGGFYALNKGQIDANSAVIILESWFSLQTLKQ
ncbi:MAG: Holliday junction resolvase RuvX [Candidatus Malihini olakiniferum]